MFLNLKIAITDEAHLRAVCEVLEALMCKKKGLFTDIHEPKFVCACDDGQLMDLHDDPFVGWYETTTLSDLLRMRDEMVKENARH